MSSEPAPNLIGEWARCWDVTGARRESGPVQRAHLVEAWLCHAPQSHPRWPWHLMSAATLPAGATRVTPEATHEFSIYALNPNVPVQFGVGELRILCPADFLIQFSGCSDELAKRVVRASAGWIASGELVPDERWRPFWAHRMIRAIGEIGTELGMVPATATKGPDRALN